MKVSVSLAATIVITMMLIIAECFVGVELLMQKWYGEYTPKLTMPMTYVVNEPDCQVRAGSFNAQNIVVASGSCTVISPRRATP